MNRTGNQGSFVPLADRSMRRAASYRTSLSGLLAAALVVFAAQGAAAAGEAGGNQDAKPPAPASPFAPANTTWVTTGASCTPAEGPQREQVLAAYRSGQALLHAGTLDPAREQFLKVLELDPRFCDAMDELGIVARRSGRLEESIDWYRKSISINPDALMAHRNLALVYSQAKRHEEALAEADRSVAIAPQDPETHYMRAEVFTRWGRPRDALEPYEKARQLYMAAGSPLRSHAAYGLGRSHFALRECGLAMMWLAPEMAALDREAFAHYIMGICHASMNESDRAKAELRRARSLGLSLPPEIAAAVDSDRPLRIELSKP